MYNSSRRGGVRVWVVCGVLVIALFALLSSRTLRDRLRHGVCDVLDVPSQDAMTAASAEHADLAGRLAQAELALRSASSELAALKGKYVALETYLDREQFYGRYSTPAEGFARFSVQIASPILEPKKSVYAHGLHAVRARVLERPDAADADYPRVGHDVRLIVWSFRDRALMPESQAKGGTVLTGRPQRPDEVSKDILEIQIADTLDDAWDLPTYYLFQGSRVQTGTKLIRHIPGSAIETPQALRSNVVSTVLQQRDVFGGGSWSNWVSSAKPFHDFVAECRRNTRCYGFHGQRPNDHEMDFPFARIERFDDVGAWVFPDFGKMDVRRPSWDGEVRSAADHVADFAQQLSARGICFVYIACPSPMTADPLLFFTEKRLPPGMITVPSHRKFIHDLASKGVNVVDLAEAFRRRREQGETRPFFLDEAHWSNVGIEVAAAETARYLRHSGLRPSAHPFVRVQDRTNYPHNNEFIEGFTVWQNGLHGLSAFVEADEAEVAIFGSSYQWYIFRAPANEELNVGMQNGVAGIHAQLAFELQSDVSGSLRGSPWQVDFPAGYLAGRKALVYADYGFQYEDELKRWEQRRIPDSAFQRLR